MLPFLKPKKAPGVIVAETIHRDGKLDEHAEGEDMEGLRSAAVDLLRAINAKDENAVAKALKAAFEICDAMPHEEGEHIDESSEE